MMAITTGEVEWLTQVTDPSDGFARVYGVVQRGSDYKWEVLYGVPWWNKSECEVVATVDSRDAAVGFIKLLKEN
jgi:hypothetical protein